MKRDMDLVRRILLEVESWPVDQWACAVEIPGVDPQVVSYHVRLLHEAGLLRRIDASAGSDIIWWVNSLTWQGHEFVEAAREETRWQSAVSTITEKGGALLFDLLREVLVQLARGAIFPR